MKSFAFTLAEVLITLGIIGVVAAMTIPNVVHNYRKRVVESILKEDYSILQQVIRLNIADDLSIESYVPDDLPGAIDWFNTYMQGKLKYEQLCFNEPGCWHLGFTKNMSGRSTFRAKVDGRGIGDDVITLRLSNGSSLCIDGWTSNYLKSDFGILFHDASGVVVYVDTNGDRGPNVIGKDIYIFVFYNDGFVTAGSDVSADDVRANCKGEGVPSRNAGYYCSTLIKNNGWVIPNDVWRKNF